MSVDVLKPAPDYGELSKQSMDESLIPVASPVSIDDLPLLTLMSQNLRGLGHGGPYAKSEGPYLIKRGGKGSQKPAYDTAILVRKDGPFCGTKLHEFTSLTSQTVVAIRSLSLVIVNVHGPVEDKEDRATFYEALHLLLVSYKAKDWTVVIGGDFNIAPCKVDRPDGKETQHSRDFVHALCSALDLVDIAACNEYTDSASNWHLIFSYARDANVERLPKTC
ncbi:hypothetical protein IWW57_005281 [Coemansia sp. S610]|nr:hypothetical protein IWW57_005281 [Coemansia sp. S610]